MPGGTLTLSYTLDGSTTSVVIGTDVTIQEALQKSCTVVPLVSMPVADTFAIDTKTVKVINVSFQRKQGEGGMTNADWLNTVEGMLNRWQCRSDGFTLSYVASADNPYIAEFSENGYVKSFAYQAISGTNDMIKGSFEFHVGTMYVNGTAENERIYASDFYVGITDKDGVMPYTILGSSLNCVESLTVYGGPENPFEYATITVPRNRLSSVAPALTEEDGIVAGRNRVSIRLMGESDMTVTKCKLDDNYYTITAYCNADRLRGTTLSYDLVDTPEGIIRYILGNVEGTYDVTYTESNGLLVMDHAEYDTESVGFVTMPKGTNVWRALQICAMLLGCRIFFANNHAYVVDYRQATCSASQDCGTIDLYDANGVAVTVSTPSLGDEGLDTVINALSARATVSATDGDGNVTEGTTSDTVVVTHDESIALYNERSAVLYVQELTELSEMSESSTAEDGSEVVEVTQHSTSQASTFGNNYLDYRDEPQQSIEFTVKEMHSDSDREPYWSPQFMPVSRAERIIDEEDDVTITNTSEITGQPKPQKLFLSTFEKSYPRGVTTYVWGAISTIDLASSTSQINSALGL